MSIRVDNEVFEGFSHHKPTDEVIIISVFDGEPDIWALDPGANPKKVKKEITRLFEQDFERGPESITFYRKEEIK